jgi:hypothetical protein
MAGIILKGDHPVRMGSSIFNVSGIELRVASSTSVSFLSFFPPVRSRISHCGDSSVTRWLAKGWGVVTIGAVECKCQKLWTSRQEANLTAEQMAISLSERVLERDFLIKRTKLQYSYS